MERELTEEVRPDAGKLEVLGNGHLKLDLPDWKQFFETFPRKSLTRGILT